MPLTPLCLCGFLCRQTLALGGFQFLGGKRLDISALNRLLQLFFLALFSVPPIVSLALFGAFLA
jgi:hypothetical protein